MNLRLFKNRFNIESTNTQELLSLAREALEFGDITQLDFARINSDLTPTPVQQNNNTTNRAHYTQEQVLKVLKSHLDVYDGVKDVSAHLNFMRELFGESSSQYRNGSQYNKRFHKTLDEGDPNLGHSMPANWADGTLEIIKDRPIQFNNTLDACQAIYDAKDNGNMLNVIRKWKTYNSQ